MPETGTAVVRADYEYDAAGKPTKESYGNGTSAQYAYDPANLQLTSLKHYNAQNALLRGTEYQRDDVGSPTQLKTVWNGGNSINNCGYDEISRLTSASSPTSATFTYDWVGNRTGSGTGWGSVNAVDQLPSSPGSITYEYDPLFGNLSDRNGVTFDYDNYNMLSAIHWNGSTVTGFVNDAAGNRVQMTTSGQATYNFIYDTTAGIPAVLAEIGGANTKLYIRTPDGRLVGQVHINENGTVGLDHYYHFDALGSTIALTNGSGTVTDTYTYDVWGVPTHASGSTVQPYLFVGQLGYHTHYQDPMMNPFSPTVQYPLLQLGVRYYDPQIGRFTQRDPIPSSEMAAYVYCDDSATNAVDPDGMRWYDPIVETGKELGRNYRDMGKCMYDCIQRELTDWWNYGKYTASAVARLCFTYKGGSKGKFIGAGPCARAILAGIRGLPGAAKKNACRAGILLAVDYLLVKCDIVCFKKLW